MSAAPKSYASTLEQLRLLCLNVCKSDVHEAMKRDPRWSLLSLVAVQHVEADEYGPAETLEYRNCGCGSTIAKTVDLG